jgi:hypothetical protein
MGQAIAHDKKNFLSTGPETTAVRANEASAQGFQNTLQKECHTKFFTKLWAFEENPIQIMYRHLLI